jgi:tetratricopeptide (TPR) repeat protein
MAVDDGESVDCRAGRRRVAIRRHFVTVCAIAVCLAACSRGGDKTASPAVAVPAVPRLPDLTGLDESLQQRIRAEHAGVASGAASWSREEGANAYGRLGMLLLAAERHAAAEPFFAAARTLRPDDIRWPYYLGHVHTRLQQPDAAATFFEESSRIDPRHVPSLIWLGATYLTIGRAADAQRQLASATEIQPSSVAAWFNRGRAALALRNYPDAVAYLERALSLDPDSDPIHYQLGLAYRAIGDRTRAEQHLRRTGDAASVVPEDPLMDSLPGLLDTGAAYLTRGLEAIDRRDWPLAVANLRKAGELSPRDAGVHLNLGTALFLSGDRAAARAAFETAIRVAPQLPKPHYTLGLLEETETRDKEAIEHFTVAVRLDPNYVEAHASLADALRRSGEVEASLEHYRKVLSVDPAASQARFGYGMALVRLGRYRDAAGWLKEGAAMHPEQGGFLHALARVRAAAPDDSVRNGREAAQITDMLLRSSRSWTLFETRAMAAAEVGQFEDATKWQQQAIAGATAAGERDAAAHMQEVLAGYRRRLPCRTPWRSTDPIFFPRPTA